MQGFNICSWSENMIKRKEYKAVFRTSIDCRYANKKWRESLITGCSYNLNESSNEKVSFNDIENEASG